ncbi:MAG: four helix bundle protein [Candidatus Daviesbacteria bacterium]|nr:four helix bundle protein [Candidatus Daviesbacteria bacterium]
MFRFQSFPIYLEVKIFIKECYTLATKFPKQEQFELASQLRRATTSILLNIAEGSTKRSAPEFNRFLMMSVGSTAEIIAILDIALDQGYITEVNYQRFFEKAESIAKQLYGFSRKLKT